MKPAKMIRVNLIMAGLLTACAGTPSKNSAVGYKSGGESRGGQYRLPDFEEKVLANGLRILFVPDNSLPYISYTLMVRVGAAHDPDAQLGLSSMVAELLDKGSKKRKAPQIAADLGQMGADYDAAAQTEYTTIQASALSNKADSLLGNFIEIITEPTFSESEIERMRKQMTAAIKRLEDNADAFSGEAFKHYLFGDHAYSQPVIGRLKTVSEIKKKHVIQHYLRYYRPNNALLAVVGQFTPENRAKIEAEFSKWQKREVPALSLGQVPEIKGRQAVLVVKPEQTQAQIHVGHLGIPRRAEDFLAVRVANTILGGNGAFSSRLTDRVRRDLGLTYSIHASFNTSSETGAFEVETFTKNESIGQTIGEILKILSDFRSKGVTESEVQAARGFLKGIFPQAIETPEKLAMNLLLLRFYGVPDSYLTNYLSDLDSLRVSDVNRAIQKRIDPENIKILVYGSENPAHEQLKALSLDVTVRKASDYQ